jgi:hypothetical protein
MKITKEYLKQVINEEYQRLSEAPKSSPEFTKALTDLVGLTKTFLDSGQRPSIGHNPETTRETLSKIMIPWVVKHYSYLLDNSTGFGENNQALTMLAANKKNFRPEFAKFFGKGPATPEAIEQGKKVRDTIKNNLLGGFIINGSRGFYKLHIYAIGEVLGMNPPQLKARTPQDQEYLDQDKERFKQQYADIIKAAAGSK